MTTTETTAPNTWTEEIAALNLLLTDPNITNDDAKARAAMRGVGITAASINTAR